MTVFQAEKGGGATGIAVSGAGLEIVEVFGAQRKRCYAGFVGSFRNMARKLACCNANNATLTLLARSVVNLFRDGRLDMVGVAHGRVFGRSGDSYLHPLGRTHMIRANWFQASEVASSLMLVASMWWLALTESASHQALSYCELDNGQ